MDAGELNPTTKYERDAVASYLHVHRAPHEVMSTAMPFLFRLMADVDRLEAENSRLRIKNLLLSEEVVRNIELLKEIDKVLESLNYDNGDQSIRHSIYIATQFSELHVSAAHFYELKYKDRNTTTDTGRAG